MFSLEREKHQLHCGADDDDCAKRAGVPPDPPMMTSSSRSINAARPNMPNVFPLQRVIVNMMLAS